MIVARSGRQGARAHPGPGVGGELSNFPSPRLAGCNCCSREGPETANTSSHTKPSYQPTTEDGFPHQAELQGGLRGPGQQADQFGAARLLRLHVHGRYWESLHIDLTVHHTRLTTLTEMTSLTADSLPTSKRTLTRRGNTGRSSSSTRTSEEARLSSRISPSPPPWSGAHPWRPWRLLWSSRKRWEMLILYCL